MLKQLFDVVETEPVLDTRVPAVVRIINGALDEDPTSPNAIVLNGRIDPNTLRFLKVDSSYQRPLAVRPEIFEALKAGIIVPNIDIGVRGQSFSTDGEDYLIHSPAYIIDGWQRVGNALRLLEIDPQASIRIFATLHFDTNDIWERHRFTELNKNVRKVSPNLHLRNMRDGSPAVLTLYGLSENTKDFALYGRVSWGQSMKRGELIPALVVAKSALRLHAHLSGMSHSNALQIATNLGVAAQKTSLATFRKNVFTFFEVVEQCWGIRAIEFRSAAPQIKQGFLLQLARLFSSHVDFWDQSERTFFVSANLRQKLAKFPINDPHIRNLTGAGGASLNILYELIADHVNSGKRTGHLRPRHARPSPSPAA